MGVGNSWLEELIAALSQALLFVFTGSLHDDTDDATITYSVRGLRARWTAWGYDAVRHV